MGWALTIPLTASEPDRYDLRGLAQDLLSQAVQNTSSNNVVVPVLQTFNVLLEADVFEKLPQDPQGLQTYVGMIFGILWTETKCSQITVPTVAGNQKCLAIEEPTADQYVHEMVNRVFAIRTI